MRQKTTCNQYLNLGTTLNKPKDSTTIYSFQNKNLYFCESSATTELCFSPYQLNSQWSKLFGKQHAISSCNFFLSKDSNK
jgi:hypothetical protein